MTLSLLSEHINFETVLQKLIAIRCSYAETRQKRLTLQNLSKVGENISFYTTEEERVYSMFPSRRQWVKLSYKKRDNKSQCQRNQLALLFTVRREQQKAEPSPWLNKLEVYIHSICQMAESGSFHFEKPKVCVIEKKIDKEKEKIICRPICSFKTLDERILASLYNRYLTQLFDSYFYDRSFAFRKSNGGGDGMTHLKAVKAIVDFRTIHSGELWVAECDMKKFYDTIDHDIIKRQVMLLLQRCKKDGKIDTDTLKVLKKVFFSYIDCFSFARDVLVYNSMPMHPIWNTVKHDYKEREIEWVKKDVRSGEKNKIYRTKHHAYSHIGVPQGGALSGLIANVVMDYADKKLTQYWRDNPNFLYVRFCDDMIMMGTDQRQVTDAYDRYFDCVKRLHLYAHDKEEIDHMYSAKFWKGKSRGPYAWTNMASEKYPWITFVGYDIHYDGETRVRRSTIQKEIKKQYEKCEEVVTLLHHKEPGWNKWHIMESVRNRLIGMSVGRVKIWNYQTFVNNYCWSAAFKLLSDNVWSRKQLHLLDYHRQKMLHWLNRELNSISFPNDVKNANKDDKKSDEHIYYGSPFSYYYQALK